MNNKSILIQAGIERLKTKAIKSILSFFKGKTYVRIIIDNRQDLLIHYDSIDINNEKFRVKEILADGCLLMDMKGKTLTNIIKLTSVSLTDLVVILKQLENMKGYNQLKKP